MASTAAELTALATRRQLASEIAHWRAAAHALADLDSVAAPAAWAAARALPRPPGPLAAAWASPSRWPARPISWPPRRPAPRTRAGPGPHARAPGRLPPPLPAGRDRDRLLRRGGQHPHHTQARPLLRGLDSIAVDSMDARTPAAGDRVATGADVPRQGTRARRFCGPACGCGTAARCRPAAAIKITRHNLLRPTSLIHETFHQVAHLTG